jgi:hypothetical protein
MAIVVTGSSRRSVCTGVSPPSSPSRTGGGCC